MLAALLTVIPGFVTMALLGSLRSYPAGLPGFWDYPSGTIGDALLVPALIAALLAQALSLSGARPPNEMRVAAAAGIGGFIGGAVVPLSWLVGSNTKPFWMLPRPHDFVLAGWVHAIYLSITTAVIAALTVIVFRRLRLTRSNTSGVIDGVQVTAMTIAVGAGFGMLVLIGRDSVVGGFTLASAATMISLLVVLALFLGGFAWAAQPTRFRSYWPAVMILVFFGIGLIALIIRWKPHYPLIVGIAAIIGMLGASAANSVFTQEPTTRPYRWPAAVAMTVLLTAGLVRSVDALARSEPWPLAWLIGGVVLATCLLGIVGAKQMDKKRITGYGLFLGYCIFMCYLAERMQLPHVAAGSAGASLSVADMAFDVLVISLVQSRFGELGQADRADIEAEYISEAEHRKNPKAYLFTPSGGAKPASSPQAIVADVALLGLAVGLGLLTLLGAAAQPLGLNRHTVNPPDIRLLLWLSLMLLALLLCVSRLVLGSWRRRMPDPVPGVKFNHLDLPAWYWVFPVLSAVVWSGTMVLLGGGPPHVPLIASAAAIIVFGLYTRSLIWNTTVLQTLRPTRGQSLMSICVGLSIAVATFWLISFGMWQSGRPLPGGWLLATALVIFLGNATLFLLSGHALAWGVPSGRKTQLLLARENVKGYVGLDTAVFGVVAGIGLGGPLYAAIRDSELHVPSLNVVASMVFIPGFISAVIWGLRNWKTYDKLIQQSREDEGLPRAALVRAGGSWSEANELDRNWRKQMHRHLEFQRVGVAGLMTLGLADLAIVLLR